MLFRSIEISTTSTTPLLKISYVNDSIEVKTFEAIIGRYKKIKITSTDAIKSLRIKLILPERKPRIYEDNLWVRVEAENLTLINKVSPCGIIVKKVDFNCKSVLTLFNATRTLLASK